MGGPRTCIGSGPVHIPPRNGLNINAKDFNGLRWSVVTNDTYEQNSQHIKYLFSFPKNGRGEIRNYVAKNFKTFFRYFSSAKHIKLFFIIKVNTFRGTTAEIAMCEISGAKNDGDFNANLHKNPFAGHRALA